MKNILKTIYLIIVLISCNSKRNEEIKPISENNNNTVTLTNEQLKNIKIETEVLTKRSISVTLKVNGQIDVPPQNMVSVSMPLGGYLKSTKLLPGLHFEKGEIIAVMEDQQYIQLQQDYLITKSKLNFAEK